VQSWHLSLVLLLYYYRPVSLVLTLLPAPPSLLYTWRRFPVNGTTMIGRLEPSKQHRLHTHLSLNEDSPLQTAQSRYGQHHCNNHKHGS
jgi:hypothetical protein